MPKTIRDSAQFGKLAADSQECRVVRSNSKVKLKLRTSNYLYTYTTNEDEAEDLLKSLKDVEVIELSAPKEGKKA